MDNKRFDSNTKMIYMSCFISCLAFLVAHISYLTLFLITDIYPLVYINIGSVTFYTLCLFLVKKGWYNVYVYITSTEIALFMSTGTMICGPEAGFQLCLIALMILAFFAGYFSKGRENRIKPIGFSVGYMVLFFFTYLWGKFNNPFVEVSDALATGLFILHILIVFGFGITFLAILTSYTVRLEKRIEKESVTDRLTNVANRNGLNEYFAKIGDQKGNYLLAIFDVDNFKKFNDKNGHLCGDYVLKEIARIASLNSKDDFVSRWGGEEFVVISKIDDDINNTVSKIDRIRLTIFENSFEYDAKALKCTVTIGVAKYEDDVTIDDWIKRADENLYHGKHSGKNKTVY